MLSQRDAKKFDARREEVLAMGEKITARPISDLVERAGQSLRMTEIYNNGFDTVGKFVEQSAEKIFNIDGVGKNTILKLYTALEILISEVEGSAPAETTKSAAVEDDGHQMKTETPQQGALELEKTEEAPVGPMHEELALDTPLKIHEEKDDAKPVPQHKNIPGKQILISAISVMEENADILFDIMFRNGAVMQNVKKITIKEDIAMLDSSKSDTEISIVFIDPSEVVAASIG